MKLRTEGVSWQELDGELVILDLKTSAYLTTNKSGALLAKLLTTEQTVDSLASALSTTYDIDQARATEDARAFIDELERKSLLA